MLDNLLQKTISGKIIRKIINYPPSPHHTLTSHERVVYLFVTFHSLDYNYC